MTWKQKTKNGLVLTKGQYAFMDLQKSTFQVDDMAVENYLAWENGNFVFNGQTLQQVCLLLNRIYGTECSFCDPKTRDLTLTTDFSNESLAKTLEVIALSLDIGYKTRTDTVVYKP
ncbi:MAG: DUF4974 domain-containing protein [Balneolaceae bacterium]|nr:DUF4974 domain-containing protein [Balneolaceae bacterium]